MGLDASSVIFLCAAKSKGVDFSSTAMIGRQSFLPDATTLRSVFHVLGVGRDAKEFLGQHAWSEAFFSLLGAGRIESVDVSPYENATILHDMNQPLPAELREQFTAVHDGGSLEHVFNVPQALKNCMEMVRVDGHFTQVNVANNFTGHGFWQFSPELIFRTFTRQNGFELEAVLLHEVIADGAWYLVSDPDDIHQRVELCNDQPTYILTIARRVAVVPVFEKTPQQSDYVARWRHALEPTPEPVSAATAKRPTTWRHLIPESVKARLRPMLRARGFSQSSYRRIAEDDLLQGRFGSSAPRQT